MLRSYGQVHYHRNQLIPFLLSHQHQWCYIMTGTSTLDLKLATGINERPNLPDHHRLLETQQYICIHHQHRLLIRCHIPTTDQTVFMPVSPSSRWQGTEQSKVPKTTRRVPTSIVAIVSLFVAISYREAIFFTVNISNSHFPPNNQKAPRLYHYLWHLHNVAPNHHSIGQIDIAS